MKTELRSVLNYGGRVTESSLFKKGRNFVLHSRCSVTTVNADPLLRIWQDSPVSHGSGNVQNVLQKHYA
jgi:hypothetical protein